MSSVTSFIKQVPAASQYFSAQFLTASNTYELVPYPSNVVGNYPPGYLKVATGFTAPAAGAIARDMGKTIYAGISADSGSTFTAGYGYFREVQILTPTPITSQGFIGGTLGQNFGVSAQGVYGAYTPYSTVYVPIVLGGIVAPVGAVGLLPALTGGQM